MSFIINVEQMSVAVIQRSILIISDSVSNGGGGVELNNWGGGAGSANSGKQLQIHVISSYNKFLAFGCFSTPRAFEGEGENC